MATKVKPLWYITIAFVADYNEVYFIMFCLYIRTHNGVGKLVYRPMRVHAVCMSIYYRNREEEEEEQT